MADIIPFITLADGTIIDTKTGRQADLPVTPVSTIEVPQTDDDPVLTPEDEKIGKQRRPLNNTVKISEIGVSPKLLIPTSVVVSLTLTGIADSEICQLLGISPTQLTRIRGLDAYDDMRSRMLVRLRESDKDQIRQKLYNTAETAAQRLSQLVDSRDEKIQLAAANSILDRTGHKAADILEVKHSFENEMRIRVIDDTKNNDIPTIDLQANIDEQVEDADVVEADEEVE